MPRAIPYSQLPEEKKEEIRAKAKLNYKINKDRIASNYKKNRAEIRA